MKRDDDLFLEALERDEDLAWRLAEAAARPAPSALRERIVARHRRRALLAGLRIPRPVAAAAAVLVLVLTATALFGQLQGADLEVAAALAGDVRIVQMDSSPGIAGRGALVVKQDAQAYLVLDLPAPPPGKAYEAWVIRDGQPLRAGMAPARAGIVTLRLDHAVRPGDIAAITLETAAGVDKPTSDPILLGRS